VPISKLVFGALTQNRSSPGSSLGFAAIAGTPRIVDHARYVQAPEEPMRDPKTLWRIRPDVNVVPVPPPVRKINSKGTAVLNVQSAGQWQQIQEKAQDYSGFG
jgi:hypothetical protein